MKSYSQLVHSTDIPVVLGILKNNPFVSLSLAFPLTGNIIDHTPSQVLNV